MILLKLVLGLQLATFGLSLTDAAAPAPPPTATATGAVVLSAIVDADGSVRDVEVISGEPVFWAPAAAAARTWRFRNDLRRPVTVSATFIFRARAIFSNSSPLMPQGVSVRGASSPPLPTAIMDPGYPPQSVAEGCVILQMNIDPVGSLQGLQVVRSVPSLDEVAEKAVRQWRFQPAAADGRAAPGIAVAGICFQRPVTG